MPLAAYFRNVGAVLFALLLIADFYLPTSPVVQGAAASPPVIRIHAELKLPAPVVLDTTQAVMAAVTPASWDMNPPAPPAIGNMPIDQAGASAVREALALMPHLDSPRTASIGQKRRQPVRYAARSTRRYAKPHIVLAARQGPYGWFGLRYW